MISSIPKKKKHLKTGQEAKEPRNHLESHEITWNHLESRHLDGRLKSRGLGVPDRKCGKARGSEEPAPLSRLSPQNPQTHKHTNTQKIHKYTTQKPDRKCGRARERKKGTYTPQPALSPKPTNPKIHKTQIHKYTTHIPDRKCDIGRKQGTCSP